MTWRKITGRAGAQEVTDGPHNTHNEIATLIRIFDSRVNTAGSTLIPPEMDVRLTNLIKAVPEFSRRDVVLTGLAQLLEICERTPGRPRPELKLGAFRCRGQTSLCFRIPLELDDRLQKLLKSLPDVSKRDVIVAALDLILSQCENINGGPFSENDAKTLGSSAEHPH